MKDLKLFIGGKEIAGITELSINQTVTEKGDDWFVSKKSFSGTVQVKKYPGFFQVTNEVMEGPFWKDHLYPFLQTRLTITGIEQHSTMPDCKNIYALSDLFEPTPEGSYPQYDCVVHQKSKTDFEIEFNRLA